MVASDKQATHFYKGKYGSEVFVTVSGRYFVLEWNEIICISTLLSLSEGLDCVWLGQILT